VDGEDESERSTLTYASWASPRADSGIHARSSDDAFTLRADDDEVGRASLSVERPFCWTRATKPGMLSLEDGDGCT
jgi:hypothetical protein